MAKWGTKNPPNKKGRYLVTIVDVFGGRQVRQADRGEFPKGIWHWYLLPSCSVADKDVIAWQKCPEPYREEKK